MMDRLVGRVKPYAWGSVDVIPELLGIAPNGQPQAELWLGAHPLDSSTVADIPLDHLVAENPLQMLGTSSLAAFGPRLPYLMKVLAAVQPLSLQTHPSRSQAEEIFDREERAGIPVGAPGRICRDAWPKPELLCALTETDALCGFRPPEQTYRLFHQLGVPPVLDLVGPLRGGSAADLRRVLECVLRVADRDLVDKVVARSAEIRGGTALAEFAGTAVQIARFHPGDPGILAALLVNRVRLRPYEALFLPAGTLHAYLAGTGVEIMANSDNVLRAGLTSKHIAVEQLLAVLDCTPRPATITTPALLDHGVWAYPTPSPEFALWRLDVTDEEVEVPGTGSGRVLLVTEGCSTLTSVAGHLSLSRGESAFVPAGEGRVRIHGHGVVFVGGPGTCHSAVGSCR